jgi:hypothetical protein
LTAVNVLATRSPTIAATCEETTNPESASAVEMPVIFVVLLLLFPTLCLPSFSRGAAPALPHSIPDCLTFFNAVFRVKRSSGPEEIRASKIKGESAT